MGTIIVTTNSVFALATSASESTASVWECEKQIAVESGQFWVPMRRIEMMPLTCMLGGRIFELDRHYLGTCQFKNKTLYFAQYRAIDRRFKKLNRPPVVRWEDLTRLDLMVII